MIPLSAWIPDAPAYGSHSTLASNCIAYTSHYGPFYAPVAYTSAASEPALGAFAAKTSAGAPYNFIGTETTLQKITSAAWEDVSKLGGYATAATTQWAFATFGDRVIAVNGADVPQSYVMGTSTDFADLDASAPVASHVAVVRGFVWLGNLLGFPNRVHWSGLETPDDFTVGTNQSDFNDMVGEGYLGQVRKIVGGENATVFMDNGIFLATYVGGDLIFTFDQIVFGTGTVASGSVASYGGSIFFLGNDGFYMLSGTTLVPIGADVINRTFFAEVSQNDLWRVSATIDPVNTLYIVGFPVDSGGIGYLFAYNWTSKRWTTIGRQDLQCLFTFYSESATLESLDALIGDPDTGPYADVSVDDPSFVGGRPSLAAIDSENQCVLFNGAALDAEIETGETQLSPGKTLVTEVTPYVEGEATVAVVIGYRNRVQDERDYTPPAIVGSEGKAYLFNTARYQRVRLGISGPWTKAYGIDWKAQPAGEY